MQSKSVSEELPALYRAILDRIAELERIGERAAAAQMRSDATQAYSRAWDDRARRRLEDLLQRSRRSSSGRGVTRRPTRSMPAHAGAALPQDR